MHGTTYSLAGQGRAERAPTIGSITLLASDAKVLRFSPSFSGSIDVVVRRRARFCCWRSSRLIERCDAETAEWPDTIPPPGGTNPMDRSVLLIASNVCYFGAEFHLEVVDDDDAQPNK